MNVEIEILIEILVEILIEILIEILAQIAILSGNYVTVNDYNNYI